MPQSPRQRAATVNAVPGDVSGAASESRAGTARVKQRESKTDADIWVDCFEKCFLNAMNFAHYSTDYATKAHMVFGSLGDEICRGVARLDFVGVVPANPC